MSARSRAYRFLEELKEFIDDLNCVDIAVVEGKHDEKALRLLGYRGRILKLSKMRITELVDYIVRLHEKGHEIALLLDYDKEGENLCRHLENEIGRKGAKIQREVREKLKRIIVPNGVYHIEAIPILRRKMLSKAGYY